ncbi:hypothetical protein C8F04DRAFT_51787 [Mycena alexandri]|uniref:Uncharacterized protein n=1 Tax=Mycena alexandri TaxID=1745969 RepID=A0AAD6SJH5_9AGAR|nr:hypothetical protein C8F04DRAFT_51787 [Mycena alexandri]
MSQIIMLHDDREIFSQMWTSTPGPVGSEHTTSSESLALAPTSASATKSSRATRNPPISASKSKLPVAAIAGAVFGSSVSLLVILWLLLLYRARMRVKPRLRSTSYTSNDNQREPPPLTPFNLAAPTTRKVRIQVPLTSAARRERRPSIPPPNRNRGPT